MISKNQEPLLFESTFNEDMGTNIENYQVLLEENEFPKIDPELKAQDVEVKGKVNTNIFQSIVFYYSVIIILVIIAMLLIKHFYPNEYKYIEETIKLNSMEKVDFMFDFELVKNTLINFFTNTFSL